MRFLVDESTGVKVSQFLESLGYNSKSAKENFRGSSDIEILKQARKENRILVTNDKDFGDLIFNQKLNTSGIIFLRLRDESVENKIRIRKI